MQFDEMSSWLDRDTGEVYGISNDLLGLAEDGDEPDLPDWQKEEWEIAKRIVEGANFVRLPTKWEVHEWEILNEFAQSLDHPSIREELLDAIHGPGAFRMFRNVIQRRRMDSAWHEFRTAALAGSRLTGVKKMASTGARRSPGGKVDPMSQLKPGMPAPDFEMPDQNGNLVSLSQNIAASPRLSCTSTRRTIPAAAPGSLPVPGRPSEIPCRRRANSGCQLGFARLTPKIRRGNMN